MSRRRFKRIQKKPNEPDSKPIPANVNSIIAFEYYMQGFNDAEMASLMGVPVKDIVMWRMNNGLAQNVARPVMKTDPLPEIFDKALPVSISEEPVENKEIEEVPEVKGLDYGTVRYALAYPLYLEGKTDRQVAETLGVTKSMVYNWRQANNLPSIYSEAHANPKVDIGVLRKLADLGISVKSMANYLETTSCHVYDLMRRNRILYIKVADSGCPTMTRDEVAEILQKGKLIIASPEAKAPSDLDKKETDLFDEQTIRQMHTDGYSNYYIAKTLNVPLRLLDDWMYQHRLAPNVTRGTKRTPGSKIATKRIAVNEVSPGVAMVSNCHSGKETADSEADQSHKPTAEEENAYLRGQIDAYKLAASKGLFSAAALMPKEVS
jgi:transcriptional regulator with XRE-family HTH domain